MVFSWFIATTRTRCCAWPLTQTVDWHLVAQMECAVYGCLAGLGVRGEDGELCQLQMFGPAIIKFYGILWDCFLYIYIYIIMNMYALPFQTAQPFYGLVEWEFMGFFDD